MTKDITSIIIWSVCILTACSFLLGYGIGKKNTVEVEKMTEWRLEVEQDWGNSYSLTKGKDRQTRFLAFFEKGHYPPFLIQGTEIIFKGKCNGCSQDGTIFLHGCKDVIINTNKKKD